MTLLPPLVITGNRIDPLGPLKATGVRLTSFAIPANRAKLQALLDKTFAAPSSGAIRYEPLGSHVLLGIAEISAIMATDPAEVNNGWSAEIDLGLWIPARRLDDGLFAMRFIPTYLFVDDSPAMAGGREVWGFPKQIGEFDFSPQKKDPAAARTFKARTYVMPTFTPTSEAVWAPLATARPTVAPNGGGFIGALEKLADRFFTHLADGAADVAVQVVKALGAAPVTMAFLKQFPDAADPTKACYQAIIEADSRVLALRASGLTNDHYSVDISSYASLPFATELGIPAGPQTVGHGIWVDFDFAMDLGREVWRAPTG